DTVTLGGAGAATPVQLKNVAAGTDDTDAVNVGQLKDTGLVGDDGQGNLTSLAVTYDDATKAGITLGNAGTPVAIHNVAEGDLSATSTDAVNGSQLFATNQSIGDLSDSLKNGGVIDPITGQSLAVVYDSAAKDTVTLGGAGAATPVQLKNVAAGTDDTDAVNVSQLKRSGLIDPATGQPIAAVTYDRNADGTPNYGSVTLGDGTGPVKVTNVADATGDSDAVNLGQLKDTGLVGDDGQGGLTSLAVTYDDATKAGITLGNAGTPVAIHNVAAGDLSATSTDAVNGSQLFMTNTRVGSMEDWLNNSGLIDPATGGSLAVVYDGTAKDTVTLAGVDGTTLSNVKAGVADTDAVNVSQLKGSGLIDPVTGQPIAAVTYDRNADGTPNYGSVTLGDGNGPVKVTNVADATGDSDAVNLGQLKDTGLVGDDGQGSLTSLAVTYDDATKAGITLGNAGTPVAIHNVAAGDLSATSTDAVNGSQLFATNQSIGDLSDSLKDGGVIDPTTGESLAVVYDSAAKDRVTLGNAGTPVTLSNVAAGVGDTDAVNVGQLKDTGLVGDDGQGGLTSLAVTYDDATKAGITLGNAGTPVAIHNVADGALSATSTDAVNGSQLFATNQSIGDLSDSLKDGGVIDPTTGESLAVVYDSAAKDRVTLAGANGTTLTNVADGALSATSTDAVNGSQLFATNQSIGDLSDSLKNGGVIDPVTGQSLAVVYDSATKDRVTLGNAGTPVTLSNVAAGAADTDAVNYGQMKDYVANNAGGPGNALAVAYDDTSRAAITLEGANGTTITNVAAGAVNAASTDAINGSQLYGTAQSVADALGGGSAV
ncbi:beta strand repeat-containing protein, partial [Burkholderia sp. MSMB1459WGS]|uniref:beta strand repeat-containing protein n=1 Tax=Burkholderia sp. MSMB1459WGS TaxID=1637970 RepID=UPI000A4002B1